MNSKEIARALATRQWSFGKQIIVPNVNSFRWEMDLAILHPSGYLDEVEIKVSRADFLRDFKTKAHKHECLLRGVPKLGWGKEIEGYLYDWDQITPHIVRRFWFAMPVELAEKCEPDVPAHCGLIAVTPRGTSIQIIRKAENLKHGAKLTDAQTKKLLRCAYFKYWAWAEPNALPIEVPEAPK